jgi:Fur family ferric uptake transcriptional regulator
MDEKQIIFDKLERAGFRITKQRKLLIDIILSNEYSSAKEIYHAVNKKDPTIGIATVYRMINAFEEIGIFDRGRMYKVEGSL